MRTQNSPIQKLSNYYHTLRAIIANIQNGFPQNKLKIIGITGTDGKTTTTSMIYHILKHSGKKVAYISTIKAEIAGEEFDTGLHVTTPDPWNVPKYLKTMVEKNIEIAIIESTSQGLEQNRLWGIRFDACTITNIRSDHLDYHSSWENYANAKMLILDKLESSGLAVLNEDDKKSAEYIKSNLDINNKEIHWYSKQHVKNFKQTLDGMQFEYKGVVFDIPLIGRYNLENTLAAINITNRYMQLKDIVDALKSYKSPTGRMEIIQKKPFTVIIDFAHTPHALSEALDAVKPLIKDDNNLITVFGCAGLRDKKRREMGAVSAQKADITILTAEDPRIEKLADVNNDIINYAKQYKGQVIKRFSNTKEYRATDLNKLKSELKETLKSGKKPIIAFDEDGINSRIDALDLAIKLANKNDLVFATGKAHEQSLCFGETELNWSEHEHIKNSLDKIK